MSTPSNCRRLVAIAAIVGTMSACESHPVAALAVTERISGCSLDGETTAVVDDHGWPHIYADSLRDAACAQGYLQARDRMAQMELFRRYAAGSLAEIVGPLSPEFMDGDIAIRALGLRARAEAMLANTTAPRALAMLDGFASGVNLYLAGIRSGRSIPPRGTSLVLTEFVADWSPVDSLSVLVFEAYTVGLGHTISGKIARTAYNERIRTVFDEADATSQPDFRARSGFATDIFAPAITSDAPTLSHFYDGIGSPITYRPLFTAPRPSERALRGALTFAHALPSLGWRSSRGGSNAWVIDATRSASGHAMLASDPHLDFMSPNIFWGSHLVVRHGDDVVDAGGFTIPGLPGVLFGFNRQVAWGVTVAYVDTADLYDEQVTRGTGAAPDTVLFEGRQVALDAHVEHIPDGFGGFNDVALQTVPHHGPIIPTIDHGHVVPSTDGHEISVRWSGATTTAAHDFERLASMMYQTSAADLQRVALELGSLPLNWLAADRDHGTFTLSAALPTRAPAALAWNRETNPYGTAPWTVLPGTGEAEWTGIVPPERLPHATTSAGLPFIASANNDPTGSMSDGNPLNDVDYLGYDFADGIREQRIQQVLRAHTGSFDAPAMQALQNDHRVELAARFRPFIDTAMTRLEEEWTTPGTHADLTAIAVTLRPSTEALRDATQRLDRWSLDAPAGIDATRPGERTDAVASAIFHRWLVCFTPNAIDDEFQAVARATSTDAIDWRRYSYYDPLLRLLEHPEAARTRDSSTGQSSVWDDLDTPAVRESHDAIIVSSMLCAITDLASAFHSARSDDWIWGRLHTAVFPSLIPGPGAALTIPQPSDPLYANGFPRGGGLETVDVAPPDPLIDGYRSTMGAVYRLVADVDTTGPVVSIAVAGGQAGDPDGAHLADDAVAWSTGILRPLPIREDDVVHAYESRILFQRAP